MAEYIEREAVEEFIENGLNYPDSNKAFGFDAVEILAEVHYMPTADVAPVVHGRWISWEEAGNCVPSPDRHECSVCHDATQVLVNGLELLSDYCPNCDAKMDLDGGAEDAVD